MNLEISNIYISNMSSKIIKSKTDSDDEDDVRSVDENETETKGKKTQKPGDEDYDISDEESDLGSEEDIEEDDDASDIDSAIDPDEIPITSTRDVGNKSTTIPMNYNFDLDDEGSDEDDDENYLQKFDENLKTNIIAEHHPELLVHNYDEVDILTRVVRNEAGVIIDPLHKTLPFLTKYEKARILGERSKQLNSGAKPLVEVEPSAIDGYLIALEEFKQKKIPFIVKRPLPHGGCEYWKFRDLEVL